jgi:hypothetical protein
LSSIYYNVQVLEEVLLLHTGKCKVKLRVVTEKNKFVGAMNMMSEIYGECANTV